MPLVANNVWKCWAMHHSQQYSQAWHTGKTSYCVSPQLKQHIQLCWSNDNITTHTETHAYTQLLFNQPYLPQLLWGASGASKEIWGNLSRFLQDRHPLYQPTKSVKTLNGMRSTKQPQKITQRTSTFLDQLLRKVAPLTSCWFSGVCIICFVDQLYYQEAQSCGAVVVFPVVGASVLI